ncbi:purine-binding chemotaxis protein CheW [Allosphingosinicella flava]|uniref:Purine-binding chemotaxis protein CheW n=1 Tax=Allosphingosinicella flava TaxID=2771430 RepID=A0A7T2LN49_9SPHN|nr:chemotaxis protein CheW [Sphingosinicella flava]QPQ55822.1 purine-binding chemotaxis protein CheW [Sphingosinicella flava]
MTALFLIVDIADERVAIPASDVQSVVELEGLTPVPGSAPHILGLSALRSRVLTVVDCRRALSLAPHDEARREAIVVSISGHLYALLVDRVDDVVEIDDTVSPVSTVLGSAWVHAARGVVSTGEGVCLLLDPAALIDAPSRQAA